MKKLLQNNKKLLFALILLIAAFALAVHVMHKAAAKPDTEDRIHISYKNNGDLIAGNVSVPEISAPEDISEQIVDGTYKSITDGFALQIPPGYTLSHSGNSYYLRTADNSAQFVLTITATLFDSGKKLHTQMDDYVYRISGLFDGKEVDMNLFGTSSIKEKVVSGYPVEWESGEAWFMNTADFNVIKCPSYSYYTILNNTFKDDWASDVRSAASDTQMGYPGVILNGFSRETGEDQMYAVMDRIMAGLTPYEPTEAELNAPMEMATYHSHRKDNLSFSYPAGWEVTANADGMVVIEAADISAYAGVIIEYLADENNEIVEDYAYFDGAYEYDILLPYFTQAVGKNAFDYRMATPVVDLDAQINGNPCIVFTVIDEILPSSAAVRYSMQRDSTAVKSIRYTFRHNGVDCMLNFILPNDNCKYLVDRIVESIQ